MLELTPDDTMTMVASWPLQAQIIRRIVPERTGLSHHPGRHCHADRRSRR